MKTLQKVFGLRTRRIPIGMASALVIGGLSMLLLMPKSAMADQNPIVDNRLAPELVGGTWLNTDGNPIKLASRRGKVTIVEFWTLGCINCKHNLPIYNRWNAEFASKKVTIIGVHTPETVEERSTRSVIKAVHRWGITYPVLVDTAGENWNRWDQQFWPTLYLIDKQGRIRYRWEGELEYDNANGTAKVSQLVEKLLREK